MGDTEREFDCRRDCLRGFGLGVTSTEGSGAGETVLVFRFRLYESGFGDPKKVLSELSENGGSSEASLVTSWGSLSTYNKDICLGGRTDGLRGNLNVSSGGGLISVCRAASWVSSGGVNKPESAVLFGGASDTSGVAFAFAFAFLPLGGLGRILMTGSLLGPAL